MDMLINAFKRAAGMPVAAASDGGAAEASVDIRIDDQGEAGNRLLRARLMTAVESLGGLGEMYLSSVRERLGLSGDFENSGKPLTAREIKAVITEAELLSVTVKWTVARELAWLEECSSDESAFTRQLELLHDDTSRVMGRGRNGRPALAQCVKYLDSAFTRCLEAYRSLAVEERTDEVRRNLAKTCLFEARHVAGVAEKAEGGLDEDMVWKLLNTLGGLNAVTTLVDAFVQVAHSQAKAKAMFARAEALEAEADLVAAREDMEESLRELQEKIRLLEKLLDKEDDDVMAEVRLQADVATQLAEAVDKLSEKTEKLVAGYESRREEILDEKRGIEV